MQGAFLVQLNIRVLRPCFYHGLFLYQFISRKVGGNTEWNGQEIMVQAIRILHIRLE